MDKLYRKISKKMKYMVNLPSKHKRINKGFLNKCIKKVENRDYFTFDELEVKELDWLWKPYLIKGNLNLIVGDGGVGKSYLTTWLLSAISSGMKIPFSDSLFTIGNCILQNAEDDLEATVLPRLMDNGADVSKIGFFNEEKKVFSVQQISRLEKRISEERPEIVVLDPIQAYLGDINMNSSIEVRNALKPLKNLAQKYNCAIVMLMHLNKNTGAGKATNRVMGSYDFIASCRSALLVEINPEDKEERLLIPIKTNLMKENEKNSLVFKINDEGKVEWLRNDGNINPNEILNQNNNTFDKTTLAKEFILGVLSRGEISGNELKELALKLKNMSERTYNYSMSSLRKEEKVISYQQNKKFHWSLIEKTDR